MSRRFVKLHSEQSRKPSAVVDTAHLDTAQTTRAGSVDGDQPTKIVRGLCERSYAPVQRATSSAAAERRTLEVSGRVTRFPRGTWGPRAERAQEGRPKCCLLQCLKCESLLMLRSVTCGISLPWLYLCRSFTKVQVRMLYQIETASRSEQQ